MRFFGAASCPRSAAVPAEHTVAAALQSRGGSPAPHMDGYHLPSAQNGAGQQGCPRHDPESLLALACDLEGIVHTLSAPHQQAPLHGVPGQWPGAASQPFSATPGHTTSLYSYMATWQLPSTAAGHLHMALGASGGMQAPSPHATPPPLGHTPPPFPHGPSPPPYAQGPSPGPYSHSHTPPLPSHTPPPQVRLCLTTLPCSSSARTYDACVGCMPHVITA